MFIKALMSHRLTTAITLYKDSIDSGNTGMAHFLCTQILEAMAGLGCLLTEVELLQLVKDYSGAITYVKHDSQLYSKATCEHLMTMDSTHDWSPEVEASYDHMLESFHVTEDWDIDAIKDEVIEPYGIDYGCGNGWLVEKLYQYRTPFPVWGVDKRTPIFQHCPNIFTPEQAMERFKGTCGFVILSEVLHTKTLRQTMAFLNRDVLPLLHVSGVLIVIALTHGFRIAFHRLHMAIHSGVLSSIPTGYLPPGYRTSIPISRSHTMFVYRKKMLIQ
jgi:hypothetical protein